MTGITDFNPRPCYKPGGKLVLISAEEHQRPRMQFRLYYSMHADPDPITQVRIFISREAALDYALRLYCDGYELYVLEGDNGEALDAMEILENARAADRPLIPLSQEAPPRTRLH